MFVKYLDKDRDSNVSMYEIGQDYIAVIFKGTQKVYKYSYSSAGSLNVENMKLLAVRGDGLNSYIDKKCRNLYVK